MSDFDYDDVLNQAFRDLRADALTFVPPQGPTAVRQTVRRRRTTRAVVAAVALVAVIAVPIAAHAVLNPATAPRPPASSQSPEPPPSTEPSPTTPSASSSATTPPPDGKISLKDLGNARLDMPAWPAGGMQCKSGAIQFTDGKGRQTGTSKNGNGWPTLELRKVAYADVDHDGAQETIALFQCYYEGGDFQVVAFDRTPDGGVTTIGQVVTEDSRIQHMFDIAGGPDGSVRVQVGDVSICCGVDPLTVEHQWRRYALDGDFRQVGGPTAFTPKAPATDIAADVPGVIHFGPAINGVRTAQATVNLANLGDNPAPGVALAVRVFGQPNLPVPVEVKVQGVSADVCAPDRDSVSDPADLRCHLPGMQPQENRTYTITLTVSTRDDVVIPISALDKTWCYVHAEAEQPGVRQLTSVEDHQQRTSTVSVTREP